MVRTKGIYPDDITTAIRYGHIAILKYLYEVGASSFIKDDIDHIFFDMVNIAAMYRRLDILKWLDDLGYHPTITTALCVALPDYAQFFSPHRLPCVYKIEIISRSNIEILDWLYLNSIPMSKDLFAQEVAKYTLAIHMVPDPLDIMNNPEIKLLYRNIPYS